MDQNQSRILFAICALSVIALLLTCQSCAPTSPFAGTWRTVLDIPDGGLPFHIEITEEGDGLAAGVRNGEEYLPFSTVEATDDTIKLAFPHYNAWFEGSLDPTGEKITGDWVRCRGTKESSRTAFAAYADVPDRFEPIEDEPASPSPIEDVTGKWDTTIGESDGGWRSLGIFEQDGQKVTGTFLTKVGDFRYLEGTFEKGVLRLSVFDGCHSFLVHAKATAKGVLEGTFWFGSHGSPLKATADGKEMPDPWTLTKCISKDGTFSFSFPDANGNVVSNSNARFAGKPLVVCVVGTWCCNCYDAGRLLAELHDEYHSMGLEIVVIACEATGKLETDAAMMRAFSNCWNTEWPVLYAGRSNKKMTLAALPDLDVFLSYPTTIFIDRAGKVREILTGFTGPGTGEYYDKMCARIRAVIDEILAE